MESVSAVHVQMEDPEGSQLSPACMLIPLVLRKILEHCSTKELLDLSLVSKQWNYEARTVIKDRGTVIARLHRQKPCEDLAVFASQVRQMNIVPYSGICIHFDHDEEEADHELLRWTEKWQSSLNVIRNQLLVKHLTVSFHPYWERYRDCPPFLWVQEVLQDHCWVLESVNVRVAPDFEEFNCQNTPHFKFPRLKKLKVSGYFLERLQRSETMFIRTVVSRAPNLQELALDSPVTAEDYRALLEGSSAVLVVDGEVDPISRRFRSDIIDTLRLKRLRLEHGCGYFTMSRFNHFVPVILQNSRTTLQELSVSLVLAPKLMCHGIPLENITRLKIFIDGQLERAYPTYEAADYLSMFFRMLQDLDFTHIFPKLVEVEVSSSHMSRHRGLPLEIHIRQFTDLRNLIPDEPSPDGAVHIKHLKYVKCKQSPMNVPLLASIFPHIEALRIENCSTAPPLGLICQQWVQLTQLVVHTQEAWGQNWDSVVCGLFPEEIAQLREEDEEYLKAVNIVPVMPSITCMWELRTFTVLDTANILHEENDPTYIFSKVTHLFEFDLKWFV